MQKQQTEVEILMAIEEAEATCDRLVAQYERQRREGIDWLDISELQDTREYINTLHHDLKRVRASLPPT